MVGVIISFKVFLSLENLGFDVGSMIFKWMFFDGIVNWIKRKV